MFFRSHWGHFSDKKWYGSGSATSFKDDLGDGLLIGKVEDLNENRNLAGWWNSTWLLFSDIRGEGESEDVSHYYGAESK